MSITTAFGVGIFFVCLLRISCNISENNSSSVNCEGLNCYHPWSSEDDIKQLGEDDEEELNWFFVIIYIMILSLPLVFLLIFTLCTEYLCKP